jgi:peptide/nickel transport system permease protein
MRAAACRYTAWPQTPRAPAGRHGKARTGYHAALHEGAQDHLLLLRHLLPNCMAPIIVLGTLDVATAIIVEAALSFLGLGTQPPTPSWGWDLRANVVFMEDNPWIAICPGLAIFITVLGFNMFGDGLRDALDPRLKQ